MKNEELIRLAKAGDSDAYDKFFVKNQGLVHYIATKFHSTLLPHDELFSLASFGMVKAFNSFDPDKNIKFATYGTRCMENEILMFLRKYKKYQYDQSIHAPIYSDNESEEIFLEDVLESETSYVIDNFITSNSLREIVDELFHTTLNDRDKFIFRQTFYENKSQREIAEALNISQSYISRITGKLEKKLRNLAIDRGFVDKKKEEVEMANKSKRNIARFVYLDKVYPELSIKDLAHILGVSLPTISNYRKKKENGKFVDVVPDNSVKKKVLQYMEKNPLKFKPLIEERITLDFPPTEVSEVTFEIPNDLYESPLLPVKKPVIKLPTIEIPKEEVVMQAKKLSMKFNGEEANKQSLEMILNLLKQAITTDGNYNFYISVEQN